MKLRELRLTRIDRAGLGIHKWLLIELVYIQWIHQNIELIYNLYVSAIQQIIVK